jgi:hypothetical protein
MRVTDALHADKVKMLSKPALASLALYLGLAPEGVVESIADADMNVETHRPYLYSRLNGKVWQPHVDKEEAKAVFEKLTDYGLLILKGRVIDNAEFRPGGNKKKGILMVFNQEHEEIATTFWVTDANDLDGNEAHALLACACVSMIIAKNDKSIIEIP